MASRPQPSTPKKCSEPGCGRVLRTRQGLRRHLRSVHSVVDTLRECSACGNEKDAGHFGIVDSRIRMDGTVSHRYRSACDECRAKKGAERRARQRARPESHKRRDKKKAVANTFGLTVEKYDAAWTRFSEKQGGTCGVCAKRPPVVMDHCHASGVLRGILCRQCNLAAGYVGDDPAVAVALSQYLEKDR